MSRRKQSKPQSLKGEVEDDGDDEFEPSTKQRYVKAEVCSETDEVNSPIGDRFDCQLCEEWFHSISSLQAHTINQHVPQKSSSPRTSASLECQQCSSVFPSLATFAVHMKSHLGENGAESTVYRCSLCPATLPNQASRLSHLVSHFETNISRRKCTDCGLVVGSSSQLIQHNTDRHLRMQYLCTICAHISESQKEFREHALVHSQESVSYECCACRLAFESHELLSIHVQLIHDREQTILDGAPRPSSRNTEQCTEPGPERSEKEVRILHCSVCDERCFGEDGLDEHRLFSHCKVPHADNCAECQEPMVSEEDFLHHTRLHAQDMYMYCAVCRQSLRSDAQLQLHCTFHMNSSGHSGTPQSGGEQQCEICYKTLVSREQLLIHVLEHDWRRQCPHCNQHFQLAYQLLAHVKEVHPNEQPRNNCEVCGESFEFAIQYEHHKISHRTDGESTDSSAESTCSFTCSQCSKTFKSVSALQSHSSMHKDSSVKRCPICALSFNTNSRYENHVRKHANTSSCVCQICGDGFIRREELELHMKVHKGNLELSAISRIF